MGEVEEDRHKGEGWEERETGKRIYMAHVFIHIYTPMGWLRFVGSLKL